MKNLLMMRHAKSSWKTPGMADRDRPLNKRGRAAAPQMATFLESQNLTPELVISSTAIRAVMTTELVCKAWSHQPKIIFEDELYLASPGSYLAALTSHGRDYHRIMLVGHNPGMELLIEAVTGEHAVMPTAAVAVATSVESWKEWGNGGADLFDVFRPKQI